MDGSDVLGDGGDGGSETRSMDGDDGGMVYPLDIGCDTANAVRMERALSHLRLQVSVLKLRSDLR